MSTATHPKAALEGGEHGHSSMPSAAHEALLLQNGSSAPLGAVPLFTFAGFAHWLGVRTREGDRVTSFFALPLTVFEQDAPRTPPAANDRWRIFAVVAEHAAPGLLIASCEVGGSYPCLTRRIPQMHLFERELYEKYGITPEGHPWLKPVRFSDPHGPLAGDMEFYRVRGDEVHEVAVGPIHAGVIECGHFRFQCQGEVVMHLEISLGYHHRGLEQLLRHGPNPRSLPLMEVLSGDSTVAHTWAYCSVIEALADLPASPRGQLVRALGLELERLANHTGDLGAIAGDVGFLPTLSYCGRLRGDWLNMSAMICGSRFGRGLVIPGGSAFDLDHALAGSLESMRKRTARDVLGAVQLIWDAPSVLARLTGIGAVDRDTAVDLALVGPAARACGIDNDVRHRRPLPGMPAPPEPVLESGGDVRARTSVRHQEVRASAAFCRRLLKDFLDAGEDDGAGGNGLENGAAAIPGSGGGTPPLSGERIAVALVEGWRGEICHTALTGRDGSFISYAVTDPSFHNWMGLAMALRGQQISDFPLCNKSFNLSYCGHDL